MKRLGGFSGETRRRLRREIERIKHDAAPAVSTAIILQREDGLAAQSSSDNMGTATALIATAAPSVERGRLSAGARLLRDWNGHTHVVDVTADGYRYDGTTYRSLSAIARRLTGTRWSGPRFFGL